jgi:heme exporter protein C
MPKLTEGSLHPGSGGSVGFNQYDLDNTLRMFFYPAILGCFGVFSWIAIMRIRIKKLEELTLEQD